MPERAWRQQPWSVALVIGLVVGGIVLLVLVWIGYDPPAGLLRLPE